MSYIEPASSVKALSHASNENSIVTLANNGGAKIEISHLENIGFCIELRYDELQSNIVRQKYTGAQERLPLSSLTPKDGPDALEWQAGTERLKIHKNGGAFEVHTSSGLALKTHEHPFAHHEQPILIYEGIMSLKVTDFSDRSPTVAKGEKFATRMARFRYERPEGLVLGLPGQSGEMNRNGYRFELYNTDETNHTPARRPMYQSWPILFHKAAQGDGWVGVFHDNPSRTFIDIGDFYPNHIVFESQGCNTRVYVVTGTTLEEVSHKMTKLLGGSLFPPLWAFGYQQCRWSYMSIEDIRKIIDGFRDNDLPLDCVYYDIDYMDGFRVFTNNAVSFGEMAQFLKETKDAGIHSVCIVDPAVKIDDQYPIYQRILESKSYLTNEDGSPFQVIVWAGESLLPDFGDESTAALWSDMQKEWLDRHPFAGIWNDMNEPSNFTGQNAVTIKARTKRGPISNEYNLYGYHMARASHLGMQKWQPGKRPFVITRSGYAGVQQYGVIWHGDNQAWWEHLRLALDTTIQYALAGAFYTGADVPGFNGNPPDDLAVRFFQLGAWMPLFRGHSIYFSRDKEPYAYGPEANAIIKETIRLRYSLLREWYSGFERAVRTDHSPILPVLEGSDLVRDQFLLFEKFLVAPVIERDQRKKLVYLPEGSWYRLGDTTKLIAGGRWITLDIALSDLPVFVKAGSIVIRNVVARNAKDALAGKETFEIYPDENGHATGYWFGDDGESEFDPAAKRLNLEWEGTKVLTKKED